MVYLGLFAFLDFDSTLVCGIIKEVYGVRENFTENFLKKEGLKILRVRRNIMETDQMI